MLSKRRQWILTNTLAAIPKYFFGEHNDIPEVRTKGEKLQTYWKIEQLRKYHLQLDHLRKLEELDDPDVNWTVQKILDHLVKEVEGEPQYFFKVQWLGGDVQWIHMDDIRIHDPIAIIKYGSEKELLSCAGWEWIHPFLPDEHDLQRMVHALATAQKEAPKYKFGVRVPRSVKEALELDKENGNELWSEALQLELK